ncbi:MAG: hypothetical protein KC636_34125 [Myxococcales bacterium]|nr:hypothetical protein [Myxococcales bacterium]
MNTNRSQHEFVVEALREASSRAPGTTDELWHLAYAVANTRRLIGESDDLSAAASLLEAVPQALIAELHAELDVPRAVSVLRAALRDVDEHSSLDSLLQLEELYTVAVAMDYADVATAVLGGMTEISKIWPPELDLSPHLAEPTAASTNAVRQCALLAISRARDRPGSRVIREVMRRVTDAMHELIFSVNVTPVTTLDSAGVHEFDLQVEGSIPEGLELRLIIVDDDHPTGELLRAGQDYVLTDAPKRWRFDSWRLVGAEEEAIILAFFLPIGSDPDDLTEAFACLGANKQASMAWRWISPARR